MGGRCFIYFLPLPFAAHSLYPFPCRRPAAARACSRSLLFWRALEALLVVLFRALPQLENAFLHHPLAALFVSPNTLAALFDAGRNNVLDPGKAGGLFVNANIAATYLGMSAIAAWYVG